MSEPYAPIDPGALSPYATRPKPPGVVQAAAILTWVTATATAGLTLVLGLALLVLADPIFDAFDSGRDNPRWALVLAIVIVVAMSAAADVLALWVTRGHQISRWALVALSLLAALGGLVSAFYVIPVLVTAAALTVVVLLLMPKANAWFRTSRTADEG